MWAKNKNIYAWREQAIMREIATHDLYCCLLPQCEAMRTCRSGFPIATILKIFVYFAQFVTAKGMNSKQGCGAGTQILGSWAHAPGI